MLLCRSALDLSVCYCRRERHLVGELGTSSGDVLIGHGCGGGGVAENGHDLSEVGSGLGEGGGSEGTQVVLAHL